MSNLDELAARVLARLPSGLTPATPADDLAAFDSVLRNARIVGIGESFHHTHELLEMRARLTRHLVECLGFRTILFEALPPGENPIDQFINGGREAGEPALIAAKARMWRNRETQALIEWLRSFNQAHPHDPVRIAGMDVLTPGNSMRIVLDAVAPDAAEQLAELSRGFDVDGREDQSSYNRLSDPDRTLLHDSFAAMWEGLTAPDDRLRIELGNSRYEAALLHCRVVRQALEMMAAGSTGWVNGFALRDRAIADNAVRVIEQRSGRGTVILSHNAHVNAAASRHSPDQRPIVPIGRFLRDRFGEAYVAIGTTFGSASFDPPIYGIATLSATTGSRTLDGRLQDLAGGAALLVDLRGIRPVVGDATPIQGIGSGGEPFVVYDDVAEAFDLIVHLPAIGNAGQLIATDLHLDFAAVDRSRYSGPQPADLIA